MILLAVLVAGGCAVDAALLPRPAWAASGRRRPVWLAALVPSPIAMMVTYAGAVAVVAVCMVYLIGVRTAVVRHRTSP